MKLFPSILCALLWATLTLSASLEDLFQLKEGQGNEVCSNDQRNLIRSWLSDSLDLTTTVLNGLNNPGNDPVLLNNLRTFLGITYEFRGPEPVILFGDIGKLEIVKGQHIPANKHCARVIEQSFLT